MIKMSRDRLPRICARSQFKKCHHEWAAGKAIDKWKRCSSDLGSTRELSLTCLRAQGARIISPFGTYRVFNLACSVYRGFISSTFNGRGGIGHAIPGHRHRSRPRFHAFYGFPSIGDIGLARLGAQLKCTLNGRRSVHLVLVATASELEQKNERGRGEEGKINKYRFGQRLWAGAQPPPPNCVKDHRYDFSPNTAFVESRIIGNKR